MQKVKLTLDLMPIGDTPVQKVIRKDTFLVHILLNFLYGNSENKYGLLNAQNWQDIHDTDEHDHIFSK